MKRVFLIFLFVVMLLAPKLNLSISAATAAPPSDANIPGWTLTFDDEFNETSLDQSNYIRYWGETSTYGSVSWWNGDQSLILQNGLLRLKIAQEQVSHNGKTYQYTAGGFTQKTAQTYGRWVVRARFPRGAGTQGYLSLFRNDLQWPPEIDFAEVRGKLPQENIFTQHYLQAGQHVTEVSKLEDLRSVSEFHEYTVIWEPGKLTWLVDGVQKFTTTQKFDAAPMVLKAGDLVGSCDSFAGCPTALTKFPSYMDIDYIRIYKKTGT